MEVCSRRDGYSFVSLERGEVGWNTDAMDESSSLSSSNVANVSPFFVAERRKFLLLLIGTELAVRVVAPVSGSIRPLGRFFSSVLE